MVDVTGSLAELAHGLRLRAAALRQTAVVPGQSLDSSEWHGKRADEYRSRLDARRHQLDVHADECEQLAATVDALAQSYQAKLRTMHNYERNVRSWLSSVAEQERELFHWKGGLPPSGSPMWSHVMTAARRAGARI